MADDPFGAAEFPLSGGGFARTGVSWCWGEGGGCTALRDFFALHLVGVEMPWTAAGVAAGAAVLLE
ncbi:hypothetical protein ABZ299_07245, partial [Streptomyces sp. NPDC006184]|uniref:hypothetical protein n=1 Tax=Streptomyces sp. NPDC006184 TaxID=3155455 RepID=UPI0033B82FB3